MLILLLCSSNECWMCNIQAAVAVCGYPFFMISTFWYATGYLHLSVHVCNTLQDGCKHRKSVFFSCRLVVPEWKGQYGQDVTVLVQGSKLNLQNWAFQTLYPGSSCNMQVIYSCVLSFSLSFSISALHRSLSLSVCLSLPRVAIIKVFPVTSVARGSHRCPSSSRACDRADRPQTDKHKHACWVREHSDSDFPLKTHTTSAGSYRRGTLFW